jgi:hypothetical protein
VQNSGTGSYADAFQEMIEKNEPVDNIELPPRLSPDTRDQNAIYADPDPGPYSPPNPLLPKHWSNDLKASLGSSVGVENMPGAAESGFYSQLLRRAASSALAGNNSLKPAVSLQQAGGATGGEGSPLAGVSSDTVAPLTPEPQKFQGAVLPYTGEYLQYQRPLNSNKSLVPILDPTNPPPLFAPPNYYASLGDDSVQKWIASLAGVDPEDPAEFVPPLFSPLYRR